MPNFAKASHASQPERFCKYIHRYCNQTRLDGYDYCIRHILEDKTAPFRQCMFVNLPNKKRCTNAAPKSEKNDRRDNTLCPFHAKRALMKAKVSHSHPKKKPTADGPVTLLKYLEHYSKNPVQVYGRDSGPVEKFQATACEAGRPSMLSQIESLFEDVESVNDVARIENLDDEFCGVEKNNDYLEHAGVYTHKEVISTAKEKILRLQQLYCDELKVVYRELKEKRRKFLASTGKVGSSESSEVPAQKTADLNKDLLIALTHYHRCDGVERILRHRAKEQRAGVVKTAKPTICNFDRDGVYCTKNALVLSKYCMNHILSDPNQVLFNPCGLGQNCFKPVIPLEEKVACKNHFHLALSKPKASETLQPLPPTELGLEPEHFQSMDDIASLGLDAITPGSLFGLDQFGEPGESTDTVLSEDQTDLMQIQAITLHPPTDILSDSRKSESE